MAMFVISDRIDKEKMCAIETQAEEKSPLDVASTKTIILCKPTDTDKSGYGWNFTINFIRLLAFIFCVIFLVHLIKSRDVIFGRKSQQEISEEGASFIDQRVHLFAMKTINETEPILEAIRQENTLMADKNKLIATDYLESIQDVLKKRVGYSVKKISQLQIDRVQDIENELAIFERSVSTLVDGILDVTKHSIADIKSNVNKVVNANDTSALDNAIKMVEDEISEEIRDFDEMFSYQGGHINDIIYDKAQNITDRLRMILVADRKLLRNVEWQHMNFCYNISIQNYNIANNLQKVLEVVNKLRNVTDTVNAISSNFAVQEKDQNYPLMTEAKLRLSTALNNTKEMFHALMNTDDYFLGTILKELAYKKHMEMRDFVYNSYATAITSVLPAVEKVTRNFKIVKDSYWKQIRKTVNPELANLSKMIQEKASLITDDLQRKNNIVQNSEFKSIHATLENKSQEISSRVNSLFETKQNNMIEGFTLTLVFTMDNQLPPIASWSLRNYLSSDVCPLSVEFQTYLKGIMDQYLSQPVSTQVMPDALEKALETDNEFEYFNDYDETENEIENNTQLFDGNEVKITDSDSTGIIGMIMDVIDMVMMGVSNAGLALDGPVEVYVSKDEK